MLWIILGILAATCWSLGAFIDNYHTDVVFKGKTPQATKLTNGPLYMIIAIIMAIIFHIEFPELWQTGLILLSGIISSIGTFAYFQALKNEEATGATIFYQLQPIMIFAIDFLLFGEQINTRQIIGFLVLLAAPIVIIMANKRSRARRMEISAALLLTLYVAIATVSAEIFIRTGEGLNFVNIIPIYLFGRGFADFATILIPKFRRRHKYAVKRYGFKYIGSAAVNMTLCSIADFCYRYSLIIGVAALSAAITNASELIITFLFGLVFSIIWPKFGREKLQKRIVLGHAIAIILCVIGIIIIK